MKTKFLLLMLLFPFATFAQIKGTIRYTETMNLRMPQTDDPEMQRRLDQMPRSFDNYKVLYFNETTSMYTTDEDKTRQVEAVEAQQSAGSIDERGNMRGGMRRMMRAVGGGGGIYRNLDTQTMLAQINFLGRDFLVDDQFANYAWQVSEETQMVLGHQVVKATFVDTSGTSMGGMPRMNFGRGGRDGNRQGQNAPPAEAVEPVTIVAWFAPDIAAPVGPGAMGMLPGAILKLEAGDLLYVATAVEMDKIPDNALAAPTKGQKMSRAEFNKMMEERMQEMRQNMQQGRREGGGMGGGGMRGGH